MTADSNTLSDSSSGLSPPSPNFQVFLFVICCSCFKCHHHRECSIIRTVFQTSTTEKKYFTVLKRFFFSIFLLSVFSTLSSCERTCEGLLSPGCLLEFPTKVHDHICRQLLYILEMGPSPRILMNDTTSH